MTHRYLIIFIACFTSLYIQAQDFSNKGKDFWIAYPAHIDGTASVMGIYITSDVNATGTIQVGPTASVAFTVTANQVTRKFIGSSATADASNNYVLITEQDGVKTNAGIHLVSDKPVVVYTHIIRSARSGACLTLPTTVLGIDYVAPSNSSTGSGGGNTALTGIGEITVVATQPNTVIEVNPTVPGIGGKAANVPFQITLPAVGDVYQFQGMQNADISGTTIKSIATAGVGGCKPIAVFSASTWSAFGCTGSSGGDNLLQQLFPTRTWGKRFVTAPFINRPFDIYRIFVIDPTTKITVINNGVSSVLNASSYNANGRFYSITTSNPLYIEADKQISVVQYIVSQNCKTGCPANGTASNTCFADPEMVILNPEEQTLNDITFFSAHQNYVPAGQTQVTLHYVNVIINKKFKASVRIDNALPSGTFVDIAGTEYSFLQENISVSSGINPVHNIKADTGFSAIVYGYGQVESYGYNGGTNVKDLYQFISLKNEFATVNFPATCKNAPFNYSITLPYKATSLSWDFNNNVNLRPNTLVVNNAPVPDSSFVLDNRTLYLYKLPGTYTFINVGTYPVKVLANNPSSDGCTGIQEINYDVEVYDAPRADWSTNYTGCFADTTFFLDKSIGNGRPFVQWYWNFGDGTVDTTKNAVKKFLLADTFNISLRAITDIGCVSDTIMPLIVAPLPVAKFSTNGIYCPGSNINFSDSSVVAAGTIVKWNWNFGNGTTLVTTSGTVPAPVYNVPGNYIITLQVESAAGCKSNIYSQSIIIRNIPEISFNLPGVCLPSGVAQFTNATSVVGGGVLKYNWSFGDGGIDSVRAPVHVYTNPGPYNVRLQSTSVYGCQKDTTIIFNNIFARPKANFGVSANRLCVSDSLLFSDSSVAPNSTIKEWFWNFGDGSTSALKNPVKKFSVGGTYRVLLYINSNAGCVSDTLEKVIKVDSLPTAAFTIASIACEGKALAFTSQSVPNSGFLTSWNWQFGDGTVASYSTGATFNKIYSTAGSYRAKLVAISDGGCISDTLTKTFIVHPKPKANFITPEICLNDAFALFKDSSFIAGQPSTLTYQWGFGNNLATAGNPNSSTQKNPSHKYSAVGNYPVLLVVTSVAGCMDSTSKLFTVNGSIPKSQFIVNNVDSLCSNTLVSIQNKSTVDFGGITKIEIIWDKQFSPQQVDTDDRPFFNKIYTHKFATLLVDKVYQVSVKAYSGSSCVNENLLPVTVHAAPMVNLPALNSICLDATARQFTMPSNGNVAGSGIWSGVGVGQSGLFTPAVTGAGVNTIFYNYTSVFGCGDSAKQPITVWPSPVAAFGISPITCEKSNLRLFDSSKANAGKIVNWVWNTGVGADSVVNNGNPVNYTIALAGIYTVKLKVVTDSGCQSAISQKLLTVYPKPKVNFSVPSVCLPGGLGQFFDSTSIADNTQALFTYRWQFGDGPLSGSSLKNPTHYYSATGPYTVKLLVVSSAACIDSLSKPINTIYRQPKADFRFTPADTCAGGTIYFTDVSGSQSNTANRYWAFGDGSVSNIVAPVKKMNNVGSFVTSFYFKNQQNCFSDTVTKIVVIHAYPVVNAGPDKFILEGDTSTIKAVVTGSNLRYVWLPGLYLNNATVVNPVTLPLADITYRLTATGIGGCKSFDEVLIKILKALGIPNAFSPNGDGINDTWNIQYIESYPGATVEVFNRYGQSVFSTTGYSKPWDGTNMGKPLPVGVYYYLINPKSGRKPYAGSITILK